MKNERSVTCIVGLGRKCLSCHDDDDDDDDDDAGDDDDDDDDLVICLG